MATRKKEPTIVIPYGDWLKEYQEEEVDISTEETALSTQIQQSLSGLEMGRLLLVDREVQGGEGFIAPNKLLLNTAAAAAWARIHARMKRDVETPSGKVYQVRETVASVRERGDDDDDDGFESDVEAIGAIGDDGPLVRVDDQRALDRARRYLEQRVPGYIWGRLLVILYHQGDVRAAVDMMHDKLDEMVGKLE